MNVLLKKKTELEKKNTINPLNTKLLPKNTIFNRLVRFFLAAMTLNKPKLC